ncbi:MAG: hypothetical protein ACE5Q6_00945 [Dehalococcoidia bacterium]
MSLIAFLLVGFAGGIVAVMVASGGTKTDTAVGIAARQSQPLPGVAGPTLSGPGELRNYPGGTYWTPQSGQTGFRQTGWEGGAVSSVPREAQQANR